MIEMPSSASSLVVLFISFILSLFGSCNGPNPSSNNGQAEIVNDKIVEIILSAPSYELDKADMTTTKSILEQRFAYLNAELEFLPDNRFLLRLPTISLEDPTSLIDLATRQGVLRFRIVKEEYIDTKVLDLDMLEPSPFGHIVTKATASIDEYSTMATVFFEILENEQESFGDFTEENISRRLAIVLDSEVLIAPRLQGRISNAAQITGLDSLTQAQEYARIFNSGQLPFKLNFEQIRMAE